jgi:membrane fusion protein (multidrug efflux system)
MVFSRSVRSIEADSYRPSGLAFVLAGAFAAAWAAWFVFARVAVMEVADSARLEVDQAAHGLEATVAGRVTVTRLALGKEVQAGDVLVELDAEPLRLSLEQERANRASLVRQVEALVQQIQAGERALEEQRRVAQARSDEADARRRQAEVAAELADTESTRAARLRSANLASEQDAVKAKADADQKRAVADAERLAMTRMVVEQQASETERRATLASLRESLAQLEGQREVSAGKISQLAYDIERRQIRAPVAGRLGDVAPVRVGSVVKEGDKLGDVVPSGTVRIVGEFLPAAAVGRVHPGQPARMRLDAFPWTQYGMLDANVSRVANEPRSGHIRVELEVHPRPGSRIALQHGLPGTLEVEVDRVSPAELVFRTAGRRLSAPAGASAGDGSGGGEGAQAPDRP